MKIRLPRSGAIPTPITMLKNADSNNWIFRYQQQLDEQMKIQELEKEKIFQQFLKEKELIDEVLINLLLMCCTLGLQGCEKNSEGK